MAQFIDTHAHLDDDRFHQDLPQVLSRAAAAGLQAVLTIGIDLPSSRRAVELARRHELLAAAVGIQPNHVAEAGPEDWDEIVRLADAGSPVVAIGESGLDRYWDRAPFSLQEDYFARHLALALRLDLPIVIHNRDADDDCVRMLQAEYERRGPIRGVMHSFAGRADAAEACVALGLHISFAGMLTYKTAAPLRELAGRLPLDRLLIETDAPYLAPQPVRGQRNEPAHVVHTAEVLAAARGVSLAAIAAATTANARALFRIPSRTPDSHS